MPPPRKTPRRHRLFSLVSLVLLEIVVSLAHEFGGNRQTQQPYLLIKPRDTVKIRRELMTERERSKQKEK